MSVLQYIANRAEVRSYAHNSLHYSFRTPVILLHHYAPNFMHYSQNYSQDHCQNNPVTPEMIFYCNS